MSLAAACNVSLGEESIRPFVMLSASLVAAAFSGATCTTPKMVATNGLGGLASSICDLAGSQIPFDPQGRFAGRLYLYVGTVAWSFSRSANDAYKTSYLFVPNGSIRRQSLDLIGSPLTWNAPDKRFDIQLLLSNLTNRYYYVSGQAGATRLMRPGRRPPLA